MRNLLGQRVRCLASDRVYRAIAQTGNEIIGRDEITGERVALQVARVVRHSPLMMALGFVIQTVVLADYPPLGESAHLVRGGFLGSLISACATWFMGLPLLVVALAYILGGLAGVTVSAALRFRKRMKMMRRVQASSRERHPGVYWHAGDDCV